MANLSKTLQINFYQNQSSIVEVMIKILCVFLRPTVYITLTFYNTTTITTTSECVEMHGNAVPRPRNSTLQGRNLELGTFENVGPASWECTILRPQTKPVIIPTPKKLIFHDKTQRSGSGTNSLNAESVSISLSYRVQHLYSISRSIVSECWAPTKADLARLDA